MQEWLIIGIDWKSGCRLYATMASARRLKIGNMEKNVNFVPSIDGYARMRIFSLAQVSGSCYVSAFPDCVFVRPASYYFVFDIVFVKIGWSRQSIYNPKIIFVQNFLSNFRFCWNIELDSRLFLKFIDLYFHELFL